LESTCLVVLMNFFLISKSIIHVSIPLEPSMLTVIRRFRRVLN